MRYTEVQTALRETLLCMISDDRKGKVINRLAIKNACQMLKSVGINSRSVYEDVFEKPLLEQTATFVKIESQRLLTSNNASIYMKSVMV